MQQGMRSKACSKEKFRENGLSHQQEKHFFARIMNKDAYMGRCAVLSAQADNRYENHIK